MFLNGEQVEPEGMMVVSPLTTTEYSLVVQSPIGETATVRTIVVIDDANKNPAEPTIEFFTAVPSEIRRGKKARLEWRTTGKSVRLNGDNVDASGSRIVTPRETTTYMLEAEGAQGTAVSATTTIAVGEMPTPPRSVSVDFKSKQQGVQVTVDSKWSCQTPCRIPDLPPGRHDLVVTLPGYVPLTQQLDLGDRAEEIVQIDLEPVGEPDPKERQVAGTQLTVITDPPGAKPLGSSQVVTELAKRSKVDRETVQKVLSQLVELAVEETKQSGKFVIPGLGTFVKTTRQARMGRNPATGESIRIPAKEVLTFRVAKSFSDSVVPGPSVTSGEPGRAENAESSVTGLADRSKVDRVVVEKVLNGLVKEAVDQTKRSSEFVIPGLGRFVKSTRQARMGRNPATGESIRIPAKEVLKFRVAKSFSDSVVPEEETIPDRARLRLILWHEGNVDGLPQRASKHLEQLGYESTNPKRWSDAKEKDDPPLRSLKGGGNSIHYYEDAERAATRLRDDLAELIPLRLVPHGDHDWMSPGSSWSFEPSQMYIFIVGPETAEQR